MKSKSLIIKIQNWLLRIRLHPIRVFCFHQVSDEFDPNTMLEGDWIRTDVFKQRILALKRRYTFISLSEVTGHLRKDRVRLKRYVALTADDGWASLKGVLPWLAEQNIPVTLFLNPYYMDGKHFRERDTEKYLTLSELENYSIVCPKLSVAMHGWEHRNVTSLSELEFRDDIEKSMQMLEAFSNYTLYYAYPWGKHVPINDRVLCEYNILPVLMDGMKNYSNPSLIHRELLVE